MKILKLPKKLRKDYWGMNPLACKELGIKGLKKVIYVNPEAKGWFRDRVIKHEKVELKKMSKGWKYKKAHKYAEKHEL